jgi:hypothetical protein
MNGDVERALVSAALTLRAGAPDQWQRMLQALDAYRMETATKMVDCVPEMLPRAQGMALAAKELVDTLMRAPELHNKMQELRTRRHG